MNKSRLEAFSDGVLAILITIMVLELKIPHEASMQALEELLPVFTSYVMSFVFIGIYWGNHHHLMHTVRYVNGKIIWLNMGLLFFLSIVPFTTGWMGENHFDKLPVACYSLNLLLCGISFYILQNAIMSGLTQSSRLVEALLKQKKKGMTSLVIYMISVGCAFIYPLISALLIVAVAILWVIPDKNIEEALRE